jgi:hypothetical protein
MRSTLKKPVPPYLGADLTDRYAIRPRPIDVCGLTPVAGDRLAATFWQWHWDAPTSELDVTVITQELGAATCSMIDGPQALALPGRSMRSCDKEANTPARVPDSRPSRAVPFGGFVCSSLDLFNAVTRAGIEIGPRPPKARVGEVYPGAIWPKLAQGGLPKKTKREGAGARRRILEALGITSIPPSATHDQLDAAVAALTAAAADGAVMGVTVDVVGQPLLLDEKGVLREGQMVVPRLIEPGLQRRVTAAAGAG